MVHCKRLLAAFCLLLSVPLLLAMGSGDSEGPTRIPEPRSNYRVILTDMQGTQLELTEFSIEGQDFFLGKLGQGELAVAFAKVKQAELANMNGKLTATLTLKDDKRVKLAVKPKLLATGKSAYGNFRISLNEVQRIEIKGLVR
jgi:hypothetical protein